MTEMSFLNYFGGQNDFENLKKWFKVNADLYKEVLLVAKERCDLEIDYSSKLSKLSARLLKAFQLSKGSVCTLWSNTAHHINEESEIHKRLGNRLQDEFYKPLTIASDQFIKFKKPVEVEIDKCLRSLQEKREDEMKNKKKTLTAMKDCEKAFENIEEYKKTHPSSLPGNDKDRTKIEKRARQLMDLGMKAEKEYFESSVSAEESRHQWEQSYLVGLEQLQKFETDRLKSMKGIIENYQKLIDEIPAALQDLSSKILTDIHKTNINDDLVENAMHYTNKSPNVYKTEQVLLTLYSESKENTMDINRRVENIEKRISSLYQEQKKYDNLRTGTLKMLTVYEDSPQFSDDSTWKKTKREFCKTQSLVNLLSANIYKLLLALNNWQQKPPPPDPLLSLGMRIINSVDRNNVIMSTLESSPGSTLGACEPGILSRSNSNNGTFVSASSTYDDEDDFDEDYEEQPVTRQAAPLQERPISQLSKNSSIKRPLPALPNRTKCQALHNFIGRDREELSFNEGDIIAVTRKINDIWWEGELKGKVGLIPRNYVSEL